MISTDNLRRFRRILQGRGINLRKTIVTAGAFASSETSVTVTGIKATDEIVSVLDLTSLADVGYRQAVKATLAVQAGSNKGLDYNAKVAGAAGNNIEVEYLDPAAASQALTVTLKVDGTKALISVSLATNGGSSLISTAAQVMTAVLEARDAAGHPYISDLADVVLHAGNDGSGVVAAYAKTSLAGGKDSSLVADGFKVSSDVNGDKLEVTWITQG